MPATGELRLVPLPPSQNRHVSALLLYRGALWVGLGDPCQVFRLLLEQPRQPARLVWQQPEGAITSIEPDSAGQLLFFSFERSWRLTPAGRVQPVARHSNR